MNQESFLFFEKAPKNKLQSFTPIYGLARFGIGKPIITDSTMSMPAELVQVIVKESILNLSHVALLLTLRRVNKCWRQEVQERVFQILTDGKRSTNSLDGWDARGWENYGLYREINATALVSTKQSLNMLAAWIVLAALSAACRTDANLTSVRMAIYTISHWFTDQVRRKSGLKEPRDTALQEWREEVGEKVARALEQSNVRPTREHIQKLVQLATTCRTCKRGDCTTGCDPGYACMYACKQSLCW
jgi:hypothetical protein